MVKENTTFPNEKYFFPQEGTYSQVIKRVLRVNHAGEIGAKYIYIGQIAVIKDMDTNQKLKTMLSEEKKHLKYFEQELKKRSIYPSILSPVWSGIGLVIGITTGLLGKKHAMACTVAIEKTIDNHYSSQEKFLEKIHVEKGLLKTIAKFRKEEMEHHDHAIRERAQQAFLYQTYHGIIRKFTKNAIYVASII
jgi:3-demethoxyubiquinol 3-hydroxylase